MPTLADAAGRWKAKVASAAASEFSLEPQPGKQTDFYNTKADICIFGGAAGAGKSRSLLLRAAKHIHVPGYGATIFRSTRPEITNEGGLWDESKKLYKDIPGVTFREGLLDWSFPAGSAISFAHSDRLAQKFVGSQIGFCVEKGTLILMGDRTYKPIENIKVGDFVMTLQGAMPVTYLPPKRTKQAYCVITAHGSLVGSADHRVLTENGWQSLDSLAPTECCISEGLNPTFSHLPRSRSLSPSMLHWDLQPSVLQPRSLQSDSQHPETSVFSVSDQSASLMSGDKHQDALQLRLSSSRLVLHAPSLQLACARNDREIHHDALSHAHDELVTQDSRFCCRHDSCFCDEQSRNSSTAFLDNIPSQVDVEESCHSCWQKDEKDNAPSRPHQRGYRYSHPYTKDTLVATEDVCFCDTYVFPVGEREFLDLRVLGASHYITHGGIISQNCGIDELQYWAEDDFWFLLSRNRTDCGVKPQLAATCNPNADSFVADLIAWWIDPEGYPIPERSGVLRYFYRFKRTIYWADTPEELMERFPELGKVAPPKSLTFISATIYDNPIFIEKNPEYLSSLLALPEVEMMRLLKGNWRITDSKASLFKLDKVSECAIGAWSPPIREGYLPNHYYLLCVDPNFGALGEDFYELQVWDITKIPYSLVYEFRDNEHGSEYHREQTLDAIDLYEPTLVVFEGNSGGKPMAESIQSDRPSYRVETVNTGRLSKVQNTDRVALAVEQGEVIFPADWIGIDEMRKFGKLTRTALSGHDDVVMCWAIGFAMIEEARSTIVDHSWILDSVQ